MTNSFFGLKRAGLAVVPPSAHQLAKGAAFVDRIEQVRALRAGETAKAVAPTPETTPAAKPERFTDPKPLEATDVLSPASVNQFVYDCQAKWMYKRVFGYPDKPSAALALGKAVHSAVEANYRQKIDTREDLPTEGVVAVFMDELTRELDGVELDKTESVADLREAGEVMTKIYMEQCAPRIQPAALEVHVTGKIGDVPVQGFIDLLDVDGNIIDLKTKKQKPSGIDPGYRLQVSTYAMLEPRSNGRARLDTMTKTKTVGWYPQTLEIGASDRKHAERLYSITRDQMQAGVFIPNRGSHLCSRKYCAYADRCVEDYGGSVK